MPEGQEQRARVLLVSFVVKAAWTGMGHWTQAVSDSLQHEGFRVDAWYADQFPRSRGAGRLAVVLFPLALVRRLLARRHDYDAVVVHEPVAFWYAVARKMRRRLPPLVVMCHNVETHHLRVMVGYTRHGLADISRLTRIRSALFRSWQSTGAIKRADHVLCLSSIDEQYIAGELGVARDRITRLVNGVAADDVVPHMGSGGHREVLWVGGWLDVKGSHVLPSLWRRLREAVPDAALTMVGTGALPSEVREAFDPQDRPSVTVRPRVTDRAALRALYQSADVFLLTSLSEGSPLALIEAMAAGLPVVATRAGGVPDLVDEGDQGLLFDPARPGEGADHLRHVLTCDVDARRLGTAGQRRASTLSWRSTVKPMSAVLRHLIEPDCR
jgi:glycosyltransferase involved in cell wall biosynthesis